MDDKDTDIIKTLIGADDFTDMDRLTEEILTVVNAHVLRGDMDTSLVEMRIIDALGALATVVAKTMAGYRGTMQDDAQFEESKEQWIKALDEAEIRISKQVVAILENRLGGKA